MITFNSELDVLIFQVVFGDNTRMYECRPLKEGVVYKIWVKAVTHVGEGDSSTVVLQTPTARGNLSNTTYNIKKC